MLLFIDDKKTRVCFFLLDFYRLVPIVTDMYDCFLF